MFYKYTITYASGTTLSGYAMSDKPAKAVKSAIEQRFFGNFKLTVRKHGTKFPNINSDCIMTV